jgi:hypothetical protein
MHMDLAKGSVLARIYNASVVDQNRDPGHLTTAMSPESTEEMPWPKT